MISATGFKLEATSFAIENAKETHKTVQAMRSAHHVSACAELLSLDLVAVPLPVHPVPAPSLSIWLWRSTRRY